MTGIGSRNRTLLVEFRFVDHCGYVDEPPTETGIASDAMVAQVRAFVRLKTAAF
jgi:hypothetical protein